MFMLTLLLFSSVYLLQIIVVADLDLHSLPPVKKLMHEVIRMRQLHEYDVVCSNGLMHRPHGYYDLYATVLLPDTFLYPIRHRLIKKSWEGEDLSLIRSFDEFGEVTSWDVLDWVAQEGERRSRQQLDSSAHQRYDSEPADAISANPLWRKIQAMRALRKLSSNGEKFVVAIL